MADVCLFSENPIGVHLLVILHISFDGIIKRYRNLKFFLDPGIPPPDKLLVKPDNQTCSILPPLFLCRQSVYLYSLPSHFPSNWVESVKLNIPGRGIFTKPWVCKTYYFVDCGRLSMLKSIRAGTVFLSIFLFNESGVIR